MNKNLLFLLLGLMLFSTITSIAQTPLLQKSGSLTTANGPVYSSQVVTLYNGASPAVPTTTVTYAFSNQQFGPGMPVRTLEGLATSYGLSFGGDRNQSSNTSLGSSPRNTLMNSIGSPLSSMFTACSACTNGINVTTDYSVGLFACSDALIAANSSNHGTNLEALNARVYFGDLTITFNRPVSNPVLQLVGLGGFNYYYTDDGNYYMLGFATEFDLVGTNYSLSKLDGNAYLSVTSNQINNNATNKGSSSQGATYFSGDITRYAASGSVVVNGENITTITFRIYLKGDGGLEVPSNSSLNATWSTDPTFPQVSGDRFLIATTLQAPVTVSGNVFNDPNAGFVNNSTGTTNLISNNIYASLVDVNGNVVQSILVPTTGIYSFSGVWEGTYTVVISTTQGVQGSPAPISVLPNNLEHTGDFNGAPNTGNTNTTFGTSSPFTVAVTNVTDINFGVRCAQNLAGIDGSTNVCENSTATINLTNLISGELTGGTWTRITGTGGTFNAGSGTFIPALGATTSTFRYVITGTSPCPNDTSVATVNISSLANAGADGSASVCDNSTATITLANLVTGEQIGGTWTRISGSGGTFTAASGTYVPAAGATTSTFRYVVAGTSPCSNDTSIATVTISAQANAGTDGSVSVCDNSTATITLANLITGEQTGGTWSRVTGTGGTFTAASGTFVPAAGATSSTFRYVITGTSPCPNDTSIATVTITAQANAGADGSTSVCDNSTATITLANLITGEQTGGTWSRVTGTGGTFTAGSGTYIPTAGATSSTFRYVVTGSSPCPNDTSIATVNISARSNAGIDGNTATICAYNTNPVILSDYITGEQTGGTWIRTTGSGGTFTAANGTFVPDVGATTSTFRYIITGTAPCANDTAFVTVNLNACNVIITGTIFNDLNTNTLIDGSELGSSFGNDFYVYLVNGAGLIIDSAKVLPNGIYTLDAAANTNYTIRLSNTQYPIGASPTIVTTPPSGWINSGENGDGNTGSGDGNANGILAVMVSTTNVTQQNFGLVNDLAPFICNNLAYQVAGPNAANSTLYSYDVNAGTRTTIAALDFRANALGYSTIDNTIWGYDRTNDRVVQIGADGTTISYTIPNLPASDFNVGAVMPNGYQFLYNTASARYYVIDIDPSRTTYLQLVDPTIGFALDLSPFGTALSQTMGVSDLAYNPLTGMFVGLIDPGHFNQYKIATLNPLTGNVTVNGTSVSGNLIATEAWGFGSQFIDVNTNSLYVFANNQGRFYRIDLATNTATLISTPGTAINNDGTNCPTANFNINITGSVFNDANGNTIINSGESFTTLPNPMYVYLVNSSGIVVDSARVAPNGSYTLDASPSQTYTIVLSTQQYPISTNTNSTPIDTEPPFGWVNTGENGNNNTGSGDNNPDGRLTVSVGTTNFTNANFGIEQPPVPGSGSNTASNPGGNIQVPVPTNTFTNISNSTDSLPGTVVAIRIVEFPEYVTSMVINGVTYTPLNFPSGGVTIPTDIYGNPSQPVTVDPAFNGPGNIHINFVAIDNAGIESSNKGLGSAELLLTVPLSGNVFNDLNGLIGTPFNTVDGSPTNTGNPLYAVLYNNSTGIVEQIDTIPAGGGYSFDVKAEDYTVYLTTTLPTINQTTTPTVTPPSGWVNTGENIGTTAGNDGFVNGILPIGTIAAPVLNANFGLAPIPEADPKLFIGLDPTTLRFLPTGNTTYPNAMPLNNTSGSINGSVTLTDGTMPGKVSGDDFNNGRISGATGTEGLMTFVTDGKVYDPNNNALELTNTVLVYNFEGQNFILTPNPTATDPSYAFWNPTTGQYEIENFNSNNLTVWFNTEGQSGFTFNYGWINEAGVESNIAPYTMNATGPLAILPVELTSFEVIVVSNDVQLTWTTASEKNNDRFEIERSTDGINFVKVGTVKGNGTTSLPQLYNFMDENPGVGVHYYRLKQVDFDTQFEYSKIKSAEIVGTVTIRSYPNPAQNLLNIEVTDTRLGEINGTIVLYNAAGAEMIRESMVGSNRIQLDVSQLPSGSYLLRYQSEEMISTFKVIISH